MAKDVKALLDARDDLAGFDPLGCPDQALDVGPVVVATADLLEQRLGIEWVAGLPQFQYREPSQELTVEG